MKGTAVTWDAVKSDVRAFRVSTQGKAAPSAKDHAFNTKNRSVYFLGNDPTGSHRGSSLYTVPIATDVGVQTSKGEVTTVWRPLLSQEWLSKTPSEPISKEELLVKERKRSSIDGITGFEFCNESQRLLFVYANHLQLLIAPKIQTTFAAPITIPSLNNSAKLDPKLGGIYRDLIAFVRDRNLWVTTDDGTETQLTACGDDESISCGSAEYVIQEEFHRYTGYHWSPNKPAAEREEKQPERILFLEVRQDKVDALPMAKPAAATDSTAKFGAGIQADFEPCRYSRAGRPNATSDLQVVEFDPRRRIRKDSVTDMVSYLEAPRKSVVKRLWRSESLQQLFPWMEYIVQFGWMPSGNRVWVQALDRLQKNCALVLIPLTNFMTEDENDNSDHSKGSVHNVEVLYAESSSTWINAVSHCYHLFDDDSSGTTRMIWSSEQSGYRHLYHVSKCKDQPGFECCPITSGDWPVLDKPIYVDVSKGLVYFAAKRDGPLETHIYVTTYAKSDTARKIHRLSKLGSSHSAVIDPLFQWLLLTSSNISEPPKTKLIPLASPQLPPIEQVWDRRQNLSQETETIIGSAQSTDTKDNGCTLRISPSANITQRLAQDAPIPEFFTFMNSDGFQLHGSVYRPANFIPGKRYPTILNVYGGPKSQTVTNEYKYPRLLLRVYMAIHFGFAVVMIDGRGSMDRGSLFEGCIRGRLGFFELRDQIEGLEALIEGSAQFGDGVIPQAFIDADRVAITGWSYGGYLSLLAIAERPDLFKIAIAGAPVVDWRLYDTAYTERYLGLPVDNPKGYEASSVLNYVHKFPDSANRILIVHGLLDENVHFAHTEALVNELVKHNKPHQVQVYPNERHGLRMASVNEHFETLMFYYCRNFM